MFFALDLPNESAERVRRVTPEIEIIESL